MFDSFPFEKFLFEVKRKVFLFEVEAEGGYVRLDFEFVLHLLFELFDDSWLGSVLPFILGSGEVFGAEVLVIVTGHEIMFRVFAEALDVDDEGFGVSFGRRTEIMVVFLETRLLGQIGDHTAVEEAGIGFRDMEGEEFRESGWVVDELVKVKEVLAVEFDLRLVLFHDFEDFLQQHHSQFAVDELDEDFPEQYHEDWLWLVESRKHDVVYELLHHLDRFLLYHKTLLLLWMVLHEPVHLVWAQLNTKHLSLYSYLSPPI